MTRSRIATSTLLLALLALVAPVHEARPAMQDASAPPARSSGESLWPEPYAWIHAGGISYDELPAVLAKLPFERIQLERTECFGPCPAYTVTLHRDLSAEYKGSDHAPRKGDFTGKIGVYDYGRLCCLLESLEFEKLSPEYSRPSSDGATTFLRVWRDGASDPITVRDYGFYGPIELWGLHQAIDGATASIAWTAVK